MEILEHYSLLPFNTFRIPAKARYFVEITTEEDLVKLFKENAPQNPLLILGGGSNMLFTQDFEGTVIRIAIKGVSFENRDADVLVTSGAGEVWDTLVQLCISQGYAGIENLSLIPGTVGASPVQNIGAYGVELKDVFHELRAFDLQSHMFTTFNAEACHFAYRDSIFKEALRGRYIITSVCLRLSTKADLDTSYGSISHELEAEHITSPTIADIGRIVSRIRVAKLPDPKTIGNAGSFFKNPLVSEDEFKHLLTLFPLLVHYPMNDGQIKLAAGWLIEQCGWKGKVLGNAGTWHNQALVLVNHGGASGREILDLAHEIINSVRDKFGVNIEPEVNII